MHRPRDNFWNFRKANWDEYHDLIDKKLSDVTFSDNIDKNWNSFKNAILYATKQIIPRGNLSKYIPDFVHLSQVIWSLIDKRNKLQKEILKYGNSSARPELNKINAEIKRTYALIKREKWYELFSKLDARSSDTKLWRLSRSFCQESPLSKVTNTIVNTSNSAPLEDGIVANLIGSHIQQVSVLDFNREDKKPSLGKLGVWYIVVETFWWAPHYLWKNFKLRN
ncbi:RNA-directed DNA polymerase from mobile element jockey [Trichonephila inaurata madagascariensis]|uniref:RNA-directed DNA polymerase from mobile element jockey n=1 Tax=Trichonephila inaurata madagascariensis TaxID=2747483 RepID=A0A8X7C128_9ARAC|nr:RNA-directed DNA polymerase from mobile element jockey [Trichonephila inaurata madagascariensis]